MTSAFLDKINTTLQYLLIFTLPFIVVYFFDFSSDLWSRMNGSKEASWAVEQIELDHKLYDMCDKSALRDFVAVVDKLNTKEIERGDIDHYNEALIEATSQCCTRYIHGCMEHAFSSVRDESLDKPKHN